MPTEVQAAREYHYAPISGDIVCVIDGVPQKTEGWSGHHELMQRFLNLRADEKIVLLRTVNYGHQHFHGHAGRVDIYGQTEP